MINERYRLIEPRLIRVDFSDDNVGENDVVVRPTYLSICAADERYFQGLRDKKVLAKKLPMCLIHEAVGEVVYDPKGIFQKGQPVVMVPNVAMEEDEYIKENYRFSSKFCSSSLDGFMQQLVVIDRVRVLPYHEIESRVASLFELMSVGMNAYKIFSQHAFTKKCRIGLWGSGSVGFITGLVLKKCMPEAEIIIMGTDMEKLNYFSYADGLYTVDAIPEGMRFDHAFECVGGAASGIAVNQIIDYINPQGVISLLGVSENKVEINTRMVLEKGLILIGHSRASVEDFADCIKLVEEHPEIQNYISTIISDEVCVRSIHDIYEAFTLDRTNMFKTVMKWEI